MFPPGGRSETHKIQGSQNATGPTWVQSEVAKAEMNNGTGGASLGIFLLITQRALGVQLCWTVCHSRQLGRLLLLSHHVSTRNPSCRLL